MRLKRGREGTRGGQGEQWMRKLRISKVRDVDPGIHRINSMYIVPKSSTPN